MFFFLFYVVGGNLLNVFIINRIWVEFKFGFFFGFISNLRFYFKVFFFCGERENFYLRDFFWKSCE